MYKRIVSFFFVFVTCFLFSLAVYADDGNYYYSGVAITAEGGRLYNAVPYSIQITLNSTGLTPAVGHLYSVQLFAEMVDNPGSIHADTDCLSRLYYGNIATVSVHGKDAAGYDIPCFVGDSNMLYFVINNYFYVAGGGTDDRNFATFTLDVVLGGSSEYEDMLQVSYPRIYDEGVVSGTFSLSQFLDKIGYSLDRIDEWTDMTAGNTNVIKSYVEEIKNAIQTYYSSVLSQLSSIEGDTEEMRSKIYWMAEDLKSMSYNILGAGASGESVNALLAEIRNILRDVNGMGIEVDTSVLDAITDQIENDYDSYKDVEDNVISDFESSVDVATDAVSQWGNILKNGVHFTTVAAFVNGQFTDIWSVLGDYQLFVILPLLIGVVLIFTGRGGRVR